MQGVSAPVVSKLHCEALSNNGEKESFGVREKLSVRESE